jgi:hypothetical protein
MIVLQFVRGTDFGAKAIEWFSHGADFSHVDTVLPDGALLGARDDLVGGAARGVQIRSPAYVGGSTVLRVGLDCPLEVRNAYYDFIHLQVGKPYDESGIAAFIFGRNWRTPDSWFCSELTGFGLEKAGFFPYHLATPSNKLTPPDLLLALSARADIIPPTTGATP